MADPLPAKRPRRPRHVALHPRQVGIVGELIDDPSLGPTRVDEEVFEILEPREVDAELRVAEARVLADVAAGFVAMPATKREISSSKRRVWGGSSSRQ